MMTLWLNNSKLEINLKPNAKKLVVQRKMYKFGEPILILSDSSICKAAVHSSVIPNEDN